jgi:hypothetical protein
MPSFQPNPVRTRHVQEGAENRFVTDTEVVTQMFGGQFCGRIHGQIVCPFGVVEEVANVC